MTAQEFHVPVFIDEPAAVDRRADLLVFSGDLARASIRGGSRADGPLLRQEQEVEA